MLQQLSIQNFAIISSLETPFGKGLHTITGETGAGKSILLGALGLVLGDRSDSSVLQDPARKCVAEVVCSTEGNATAKAWLQREGLYEEEAVILRREIAPNGKSRAFINDTPVNLTQLRAFAALMVDLHQQFDTMELGEADFQREIIDVLAGNQEILETYRGHYKAWRQLQQEIATLRQQQQQASAEEAYHRFLYDELSAAALQQGELEALEQELKLLSQAEQIRQALAIAVQVLQSGEEPLAGRLKQLVQQLTPYGNLHQKLGTISERLRSAQIEINDIAGELEDLQDAIALDEARIQFVQERLDIGYKLLKKHGVQTTDELLHLQQELEAKLQLVFDVANEIASKEAASASHEKLLLEQATLLSKRRKESATKMVDQVNALLQQVGMPNASVQVRVDAASPGPWGADAIALLFDANRSGRFEPVEKVASGGERSRLMLCIKSLVGTAMQLPTMIFDEIDTGISGEAAKQVGMLLQSLAASQQVIVITHQPQIAARGQAHYFVYKENQAGTIQTKIRMLEGEERVQHIARMLSGDEPSPSSLKTARELMQG